MHVFAILELGLLTSFFLSSDDHKGDESLQFPFQL